MTPTHIYDTSSLDNALAYKIHRLSRLMRVHLTQLFQQLGVDISMEQWFMLFRLHEKNGQSQTELADKVLNDHPNITRILDGLEKRNLVTRQADPTDRRKFLVFLTADGQSLMTRLLPEVVQERQRLFHVLTEAETTLFEQILQKIEANLLM